VRSIKNLSYNLLLNLKNIPGWRINKKIVVIECDDWGGIRMPSGIVYNKLLKAGLSVDKSRYTRFDTLAEKEDFEFLFDVLFSVKDSNGNPAVMTPVCNVANPDFERIKQSGYIKYYYEPFTKTLERYNLHSETFNLWREGIDKGIFIPESHGREHITVQLWLKKLQEGDKNTLLAFDHEFVSVDVKGIPSPAAQFRPEFYYDSDDQIEFLEESIKDGVKLFVDIFGYRPTVFVPGNGIFNPALENALASTGVPFLYAGYRDIVYHTNGKTSHNNHYFGQKSSSGLRYYMRNCAFEPTDESYKGVELTLKQIKAAFRWAKPAIISTHRVNFVGGIEKSNRDEGLSELKLLLKAIVKEWPDVTFMSSASLFQNWV
jgi:hypothetical protein